MYEANLLQLINTTAELLERYAKGKRGFMGAELGEADLEGAKLRGTDLSYADLRGAKLRAANLRGADLSYTDLGEANLCEADLRGANLIGANLIGARLRGANLMGADLIGARLRTSYYDENTLFPDGFDPVSAGMRTEVMEIAKWQL